jgi:predicted N-acetyltransferase YhbS
LVLRPEEPDDAAAVRDVNVERPVPPEVFMALELEPGALDGVAGVVHYRPEFYLG